MGRRRRKHREGREDRSDTSMFLDPERAAVQKFFDEIEAREELRDGEIMDIPFIHRKKDTDQSLGAAIKDAVKGDKPKPYSGSGYAGTPAHSGGPAGVYGNTSYVSYMKCSHYADPITTLSNGVELYGGSGGRGCGLMDAGMKGIDLIVNLAALKLSADIGGSWEGVSALKAVSHKTIPELDIEWRDMGEPAVPPEFWSVFLKELVSRGVKKALIMCHGGHGRTGTCAAALMVADGTAAATAIDHIRKHYCKEAIETSDQKMYLSHLESELGLVKKE